MTYLLFDIGGTNTRVALSRNHDSITDTATFKTPKGFEMGMKALLAEAAAFGVPADEILLIAGGARGLIAEDRSGIENDGILTEWAGKSIAKAFKKAGYEAPFILENDTAVAGLGEAHYGAGKDMPIVAYHTVSTGVGGVKIVDGRIDPATSGFEPGHQVLDIDRTVLGDDIEPTLENLVSGTGLEARMGTAPKDIPQEDVIWHDLAGYLAQGLRNTILYWSPDAIVLGGSMILGDPRIQIADIRKQTVEALDGFVEAPHITTAKLGDGAGLWGALVLARQYEEV
jgi:predicted NBD/HSP70 family sugar kinase